MDKLEQFCETKMTRFNKWIHCWMVEFDVPICGHIVVQKTPTMPHTELWRGHAYNTNYVYLYAALVRTLKRVAPIFTEMPTFVNPKISPLKFKMRYLHNANCHLLQPQIYNRNAGWKTKDIDNMNDIIIDLGSNQIVTHIEIVGDSLKLERILPNVAIIIAKDIVSSPYVKTCDLYYKDNVLKKWIMLETIKCNFNAYEPTLIDLKHCHNFDVLRTRQLRLVPKEWHVAPLFRIAVYGESNENAVASNNCVKYTVYIPKPYKEISSFPVRCGKNCRCCRNPYSATRKDKKDEFMHASHDN